MIKDPIQKEVDKLAADSGIIGLSLILVLSSIVLNGLMILHLCRDEVGQIRLRLLDKESKIRLRALVRKEMGVINYFRYGKKVVASLENRMDNITEDELKALLDARTRKN